MELQAYLQQRADLIHTALDHELNRAGAPQRLREAMAYSLLAGGKRLRPALVLAAAEVCGLSAEAALPGACAVEMIHTYSLIHDDLPAMDDDDLRRGRPTSHRVFGEGLAILAGDGLLTLAFEVLGRSQLGAERVNRALVALAKAAGPAGMVAGQVLDLANEGGSATLATLTEIHTKKTGALLVGSLEVGAHLAGATATELAALRAYGAALGLAFQIQDDLLDVVGEANQLGKSPGRDEARAKVTYVSLLGVDGARQEALRLAAAAEASLAPLGPSAAVLRSLATYAVDRDR